MKIIRSRKLVWLIVAMAFSNASLLAEITYKLHRGEMDESTIKQVVTLAQVYQEYPSLCCFSPEQAIDWATELSCTDTLWSAAYDGDRLIGAMIAFPARADLDPILQSHSKFSPKTSLMLEEAMVLSPYQRQGIGRTLIHMLLHEAVAQGYDDVYLLTVVRSANHPLKSDNFIDLDAVWTKLGWSPTKLTGIRMWPTRCGVPGNECIARIDNMVEYWHKSLA